MHIEVPTKIPGPQYDLASLIRKKIGRIRRPFDHIRQTRTFIIAKTNGARTSEANRLAGINPSQSLTQTMASPLVMPILQKMCQEPELTDDGIVKRIKQMWNKKRVRSIEVVGNTLQKKELIEEDDTDMWKYSMDKVLRMKGYIKDRSADEAHGTNGEILATNGITFNILQMPSEEEKPKNV